MVYGGAGDGEGGAYDGAAYDGDGVAYGKVQVASRKVYEFRSIHLIHIRCKGNGTDGQSYVY